VSGEFQAPAALSPGERASGAHWIGGWLNPSIIESLLLIYFSLKTHV
jgi:hypothetical protein